MPPSPVPGAPGAPAPRADPLIGTDEEGERPAWFFVEWRARVLDGANANADASLDTVTAALSTLAQVGGTPAVRALSDETVVFEFWFEATGRGAANRGARLALKEAFGRVGVGDPTGQPGSAAPRLRLILEELPILRPVASKAGAR